jgi:hypothetical protein
MAWKLEGTYFENCNCDFVCPCSVTSFVAPATNDRCQVVLFYNVGRGEIEGVDVSGLSVAVVADTPKQMISGNWRLGLIVDERASEEQRNALAGVFSGQKGGPMASLAPLVGEVLGIQTAPIEYQSQGGKHSVRVGNDIEVQAQDFVPEQVGSPTQLVGVFHPSNTTLTVARPTSSRIQAFGMQFQNDGKSAFSAPFSWSA